MAILERARQAGRVHSNALIGAAVSLVVAILLFTRFSLDDGLSRDQSIYVYGGQRMAHGVPPYTSIFDPKTPLATMLSGVAASVARLVGRSELTAIRLTYFVVTLLMVLAVYLLALRLWRSVAGAVVAAVVMSCFNVLAAEALGGPEAKAPGILAITLMMWLIINRHWYWAAFAGAFGFLGWQPLVIYPVIVGLLAVVELARARTWQPIVRVVAGTATPFVAVVAYFAATQGIGNFWECAFQFPATGIDRPKYRLGDHLKLIGYVVHDSYGVSGVLLWIGDILLVLLVVGHLVRQRHKRWDALLDPLFCVVFLTGLAELAYAVYDFQGAGDVFPFMVYPPLGFAGVSALATRSFGSVTWRRVVAATSLAATGVLAGFSWVWFGDAPQHDHTLVSQEESACAVDRILTRHDGLVSLGDPVPFVLTNRVSPDRFIYLGESVDTWKINHTAGGFDGWTRQILADHPAVIIAQGWHNDHTSYRMKRWVVSAGFRGYYAGSWHLYLRPGAVARAEANGVTLTVKRTLFPTGTDGRPLPRAGCR